MTTLTLTVLLPLAAQPVTRGVGVYPGDPAEDFSPVLRVDGSSYRNLALRRAAYQSSSYDYNLTAQLATDGIRETSMPYWIVTSTSTAGVLPRHQRELFLDRNIISTVPLDGASGWVQVEFGGGDVPEVDRLDMDAEIRAAGRHGENWLCTVLGSEDGQQWTELGRATGAPIDGKRVHTSIALGKLYQHRFYRITFQSDGAVGWKVAEVSFFQAAQRLEVGGPYHFASAWKSAGAGEEWIYVDLGAVCEFDRVALYWIRPAIDGVVQASDDAVNWRTIQVIPGGDRPMDDFRLARPEKGRYVRAFLRQAASSDGYVLSEMEVYGRGGVVAVPKAEAAARADGRLDLAGGAWKVQRVSQVPASGETLSKAGFADQDWLVATVPGTVLTSFVNAGAVPDSNFGDNQLAISDAYFQSDFWYRDEFVPAPVAPGKRVWLNFDGINWKADVFLNGERLGRIEGGFTRARFDVTGRLLAGRKNALAVRIEQNATPGSTKEKTFQHPGLNGGALGADNPTYHASIGWDWIPSIRGRDTGIWNDVYLTTTGAVTLENPFVTTSLPLPDVSRADVGVEVTLQNHGERAASGTLSGHFGDVEFSLPVTVDAAGEKTVRIDPSVVPALRLQYPKLWWPNGYGDAYLYPVDLKFETAGHVLSDARKFSAGVRQMSYSEDGGALRIWINGRRFIPRGGNWGFGESMLRYRGREYDVAVRYHRDMNFTMIRNWVGQIGDDEFYEACDRYGIMVWQDFWLANPVDGPNPDDDALFLRNVTDTLLRIRNHPSIGLYCGRNEGYPPPVLDEGIRRTLAELHPGIHYISSSADDVVSGHGPYRAQTLKYYFDQRATPQFHSEMGMPNIVSLDSLRAMMPAGEMWPQGRMWGLHDFSLDGAQGGASFRDIIDKSYGGATNVADWVTLAQLENYEGYRAMFEAQSRNRMGLLIWMSHPAWPSMVWQTYDYYFEPTAAYFGSKKACEPLHIQWNPVRDAVEVVNYSGGDASGLQVEAEVLNLDGSVAWQHSTAIDSREDSTVECFGMKYPAGVSAVHFLRLKLLRGGQTVSENFYWRGTETGNYQALRGLPKVDLDAATRVERQGDLWKLTTELSNPSKAPALMVKLKVVRAKSGDRILPVLFSDNYVALMPGERRTLTMDLEVRDARGEEPQVVVEGFNVGQVASK